jgi:hypothetical protein
MLPSSRKRGSTATVQANARATFGQVRRLGLRQERSSLGAVMVVALVASASVNEARPCHLLRPSRSRCF